MSQADSSQWLSPRSSTTHRAVCPHDCPDTCGMTVHVSDGRAIDLRGDKNHPFTRGFLCVKVNRYLERVYHPDRLMFPLKRIGPKGDGSFTRITWQEAIDTIANRFTSISQSSDGPQSILPYSYAGTMGQLQGNSLDRRFFHLSGASLLDRTICATAGTVGSTYTLGTRAAIDPETVIHSRCIINWGSNTSVTNMHLWSIMHQARKLGARIITIDPFKSKTAARSDWWIPIRPGTDGALALGMMHLIFQNRWQDDAFLRDHCIGAEALRERVLKEYPPDRVSQITGIPVSDLEQLTREYATKRPSLIRLNYGLQRHYGGGMAVRTICVLPAVVGAWRDQGGGALLSTSKLYGLPGHRLERPDLIPPGTRTINMVNLAEALNGELPGPPVKALYVYNSNPAAICPDVERVWKGLAREDLFTVVHDLFMTDTAKWADIVLPATSQLEHFDLHHSYGHCYLQLNEPVIAPLGECKSNTDVFRLLARAMQLPAELFDLTDEDLARELLQPTPHPADALVKPERKPEGAENPLAGISLERLKKEGPVRLNIPVDYAPFATGYFPTASGKCEIYSSLLAEQGVDPLPTYTPPAEDPLTNPVLSRKYPLQMVSPPSPSFLNSSFVNVASLRRDAGQATVILHEKDAELRGIRNNDWVKVYNDRGNYLAVAEVGQEVKAGTVVSQGIWWSEYTVDGKNANVTTSTRVTDLGGGATFFDNLVEITRTDNAIRPK
ncbi:MAG: molybdopterin oxidoreductase family protein [Planctomycetia bacterium]|nr:molybdopterin oxidoreductase family protein [Planctomycetia bacterium]